MKFSRNIKAIVFVTEAIENIPTGWRARETYQVVDANHWKQAFDLAEPGKEFSAYTKAEFVKTN